MSYTFTVNQSPTTGAETIFLLKARLKAAGWTVPSSSDGTTYNAAGDQITGFASGAGGMANNSAWFRIQDPGGTREFTFQRGTTNTAWRIKYSASAKFTTGSPGATQTPQSSDQQLILGAGTDASPTFGTLFSTDGGYRAHFMADNSTPYPFYFFCYANGGWPGTTGLPALLFDPVTNADAADTDQAVIYVAVTADTTPFGISHYAGTTSGPKGYLKKGLAGEGFVTIPAAYYQAQVGTLVPANLVSNPHSGKDDEFPVPYMRQQAQANPTGYKGVSRIVHWRATTRSTGSTLSVTVSKDRVVISSCSLPWDGSSDPLL